MVAQIPWFAGFRQLRRTKTLNGLCFPSMKAIISRLETVRSMTDRHFIHHQHVFPIFFQSNAALVLLDMNKGAPSRKFGIDSNKGTVLVFAFPPPTPLPVVFCSPF